MEVLDRTLGEKEDLTPFEELAAVGNTGPVGLTSHAIPSLSEVRLLR